MPYLSMSSCVSLVVASGFGSVAVCRCFVRFLLILLTVLLISLRVSVWKVWASGVSRVLFVKASVASLSPARFMVWAAFSSL